MKLLALAALLVAGCGHVETHAAILRPAEPATKGRVELYLADQAAPTRPFYEIALVQVIGFGNEAHPESIASALTQKAGTLGCDAVVHASLDQGYGRAHAAGVCVKWAGPPTGDEAAQAPLLPPDAAKEGPRIPRRPAPLPRIDPLPSAPPRGGGR